MPSCLQRTDQAQRTQQQPAVEARQRSPLTLSLSPRRPASLPSHSPPLPSLPSLPPCQITKATLGLLKRVEPYIAWGYPNLKSVRELIYKRGYGKVGGNRTPLTDNKIIEQVRGARGLLAQRAAAALRGCLLCCGARCAVLCAVCAHCCAARKVCGAARDRSSRGSS